MNTQITTQTEDVQTVDKISQIIYYVTNGITALLLLRLIFKAFGASVVSPIVSITYSITNLFLAPFRGIFEVASAGELVIEPSILVAIIIYWLVAKAIVELLYVITKE